MGFLLWVIAFIIIIYYAYQMSDKTENNIILKLIGYCIMGNLNFRLNHSPPLPLGFVLYLILLHPKENIKAKRFAANAGFVGYLIALIYMLLR